MHPSTGESGAVLGPPGRVQPRGQGLHYLFLQPPQVRVDGERHRPPVVVGDAAFVEVLGDVALMSCMLQIGKGGKRLPAYRPAAARPAATVPYFSLDARHPPGNFTLTENTSWDTGPSPVNRETAFEFVEDTAM
jgi:hypothetical protein